MRLVATADDTTGALETAAACADLGWRATARPLPDGALSDRALSGLVVSGALVADGAADPSRTDEMVVFDLRSRHLPANEAAARVRAVIDSHPSLRAHKVDSTLRGNWAAEVEAIAEAGRSVLFVPAFPAAGRTCVDGCVLIDGVPVQETAFGRDPRSPTATSRPLDLLRSAVGVASLSEVRAAFAAGTRVMVADASTDDDLDRWASLAIARPELVVVGPAAVAAALARRLREASSPASGSINSARTTGWTAADVGNVLVVSASQHPNAVAQFAALSDAGLDSVTVVRPPVDADPSDPDGVLADLAEMAHGRLAADPSIATVMLVGGDTAAAVLGSASVSVEGTLGVGIAFGRTRVAGRTIRLVTKPGGFGDSGTLVDVLQEVLIR